MGTEISIKVPSEKLWQEQRITGTFLLGAQRTHLVIHLCRLTSREFLRLFNALKTAIVDSYARWMPARWELLRITVLESGA
jgi:hypothetical protein